jgi:hypothetical protein
MKLFLSLALALAVGLAAAAAPLASSSPDGLNKVAADNGFADRAQSRDAPLSNYALPGVENDRLAKGLAGFVGTLAVFAVGYGVVRGVRWRGSATTPST